jgi:hypothetical protein
MSGESIMRGFRRLGVFLAVPCIVIAVGYLGTGFYTEYQSRQDHPNYFARFHPDGAPASAKRPDAVMGANPFADLIPQRAVSGTQKSQLNEMSLISGSFVAIGAFLFLATWLLGWVVAGFAQE